MRNDVDGFDPVFSRHTLRNLRQPVASGFKPDHLHSGPDLIRQNLGIPHAGIDENDLVPTGLGTGGWCAEKQKECGECHDPYDG